MRWPEEWVAMGIAVGVTAIAALAALLLDTLHVQAPYLAFLLSVLGSVALGGGAAGVCAAVLSAMLTWFFFIPPQWSFAPPTFSDGLTIALFFSIALLMSRVSDKQRQKVDELTEENFSLRSRLRSRYGRDQDHTCKRSRSIVTHNPLHQSHRIGHGSEPWTN